MNKVKRQEIISRICDSLTIIRGNAELALKVERPKWVDRYLNEIMKEVETTASLISDCEKYHQSECYCRLSTSGFAVVRGMK